MSDHTLRLIKRLLDLADEQSRLAVGASWEHRSICATVLEDAAKELGKLDRLRAEVEALRARVAELEGAGAHEWTKHEREGWSVCSRCGMVRNYDRETPCRGKTPLVAPRTERRELRELAEELHETASALAEKSVRYRHRRTGKTYVLTSVSFRESDLAMLVSYVPTECRGVTFTRPLVEFQERFVPA